MFTDNIRLHDALPIDDTAQAALPCREDNPVG